MKTRSWWLPAAAALLSGCATRVPGSGVSWHDSPRFEQIRPATPLVNWSRGLSLQKFLDAVDQSPAVQEQILLLELEGKRTRAAAEMSPEAGLEISGATPSREDRAAIGGQIRQVIDVGRRARWRKESAELGYQESAAEAREVRRVALLGAEKAYWRAVGAEERQRALSSLNLAGTASVTKSATTPSPRDSTRADLERLAGGGAPPGWRLTDSFPAGRPRADIARARDLALTSRPDFIAVVSALGSARSRVLLAESASATDFGVGVAYQAERDENASFSTAALFIDRRIFAGVSFTIPGRPADRLAEADAFRRRCLHELSTMETAILDELEIALKRYQRALDRLESAEQHFTTARIDALEEWAEARCDLEGAVGRPIADFTR